MSDVMCQNCFVGLWMPHGSHIYYTVHIRVHIVSCGMIECGMMWKRILLHSHGIHVHMGPMFALSHGFT